MGAAREADVTFAAQGGRSDATSAPCAVWGVLNVTPDSFSDGGLYLAVERAVEHGLAMWRAGASVVDVGGESTRPPGVTYGSDIAQVSVEQELERVVPVVQALASRGVMVSIDTSKAGVARACLRAGASIVNDVTMGRDAALVEETAAAGAELVLMHNRGRGEREGPTARYGDVVSEALEEVWGALERASQLGVPRERVWIDPGLGFAKGPADSARLLAQIGRWAATGQRVLVGASRKSFLASLGCQALPVEQRLPASLAAACAAQRAGCAAVRVHDVAETLQALEVTAALAGEAAR